MIKLVITNEKNLELYELEKVHVGENKFGYYLIFLPEVLNGYNLSECEVKLIQIFEDNTSVAIEVDTTQEMRPIKEFITLDATAQAQTVTLSVLITHNGNVIGKTNQKTYQVYPTKNATPIDPREDLDEIIAELRADKAELEETVSEQATEITEKSAQITELSGQVEDLTEQTTEQAETITRQNETIDQLNSRVPAMETPPIVIPSGNTQLITPSENYDGLASVTVDRVTAAVDSDIIPENIKEGVDILGVEGSYNPFPEHSFGGMYILEMDEDVGVPTKILFKNIDGNIFYENKIPFPMKNYYWNYDLLKVCLEEVVFDNCKNIIEFVGNYGSNVFAQYVSLTTFIFPFITKMGHQFFYQCSKLKNVTLPETLIDMSSGNCFRECTSLKEIFIPNQLELIGTYTFMDCISLETINIPASLKTIGNGIFNNCLNLKNVTIENGFNANNLKLSSSILYSHDTILSWFNALYDRTGLTAYTLTIGTTNLNKMTAEEKAIATNKNWNLA